MGPVSTGPFLMPTKGTELALSTGTILRGGGVPEPRDVDAAHLKAINDVIAERESVGAAATPHLLRQKELLEAKIEAKNPRPKHVDSERVEHKAEDPPAEAAIPRRPGRPRKPSDDES